MLPPRTRTRCALLCLLSVLFTLPSLLCACTASPTPDTLWDAFSAPFTCGMTAEDAAGGTLALSFVRTAEGDILAVTGKHGKTTFSVSGNAWFLSVGKDAATKAISIPIPKQTDEMLGVLYGLFQRQVPTGASVKKADGQYYLSFPRGEDTVTLVFDRDGIPKTVSDGSMTVRIHSFVSE